jgi:hypothetical protein
MMATSVALAHQLAHCPLLRVSIRAGSRRIWLYNRKRPGGGAGALLEAARRYIDAGINLEVLVLLLDRFPLANP